MQEEPKWVAPLRELFRRRDLLQAQIHQTTGQIQGMVAAIGMTSDLSADEVRAMLEPKEEEADGEDPASVEG